MNDIETIHGTIRAVKAMKRREFSCYVSPRANTPSPNELAEILAHASGIKDLIGTIRLVRAGADEDFEKGIITFTVEEWKLIDDAINKIVKE